MPILLIDDEAPLRRSLSRLLERYGLGPVRGEGSGASALQALHEGSFDVILCDLHMPGMSGEEFYERLCVEHPGAAGHVVFMSGDLDAEDVGGFIRATRRPAVHKPFDLPDLISAVRGVAAGPAIQAA